MAWANSIGSTRSQLWSLNKAMPDTSRAFSALTSTVHASGVLDAKTKEFVARTISVADRCEPCTGFHILALGRAGARREELNACCRSRSGWAADRP
ncbi:carboxymuconolactone decarboxylase family protein [Candidatus Halocynthiibacter alkanivorans]|uniref:carboxymuconolactone decarboxylase family protein n=1 Tax=Candidatus Halocynthiibacter alkanivorans TaxID=2267619 RepID=UPI003012A3BC